MTTQENPLERYTILRELGRGAIGTVYAARDRSTGAVVALKTLDPALFSEPNAQLAELFLKNARSAGRLRHANIVAIVDAGEAGGTAYVAMELVEGESLRHLLDERPLPIARAIRIFDDIASALKSIRRLRPQLELLRCRADILWLKIRALNQHIHSSRAIQD